MSRSILFGVFAGAVSVACGATGGAEEEVDTTSAPIIGGTLATSMTDFPGIAALVGPATTKLGYRVFCGGVLITPRWVLTAAHCFDDIPPLNGDRSGPICKTAIDAGDRTKCEVDFGSVDIRNSHESARGAALNRTFFRIKGIYVHPNYYRPGLHGSFVDDAALVELETDVPLTTARPAPLLGDKWYRRTVRERVVAAGWGYNRVRGDVFSPSFSQDTLLRSANLYNQDFVCSTGPSEVWPGHVGWDGFICASSSTLGDHEPGTLAAQTFDGGVLEEVDQGPCIADGGGPLYFDIPGAGRTVLATASASFGCALRNEFARFVQTAYYIPGFKELDWFNLPRPIKRVVTPGFWNVLTASNYGSNTWFAGTDIIHTPVAGNFLSPNSGNIAYYGRCGTSGAPCWRVHGGSVPRDFGASIAFQGTNVYNRPMAGDFNDDGLSDIVNWGICNSGPCWRVLLNDQGQQFNAVDYGAGAFFGFGDARGTPMAGDFNGDDYDDIAYVGRCGSDGHTCFRVHINDRNGHFVANDYGGDVAFEGSDANNTPMAGDFNGDRYDDIAYVGLCPGGVCWRVHLNDRLGHFSPGVSYGGAIHFRTNDVTSTPVAADLNGDGFTDIAYNGICGSNNRGCLRIHLNNPPGGFLVEDHRDVMVFEGADANNTPISTDFDGDGSADIAYLGLCNGSTCWRVHHLP